MKMMVAYLVIVLRIGDVVALLDGITFMSNDALEMICASGPQGMLSLAVTFGFA